MKRFGILLTVLLTGCEHQKRPTVVFLGDSITFHMQPHCDIERQSKPLEYFAKSLIRPLAGKGCDGEFDINRELPRYNTVVMGYGLRRSDELSEDTFDNNRDHVAEAISLRPNLIVLLAGTNDLEQHNSADVIANRIAAIRERLLNAHIPVLLGSVPMGKGMDRQQVRKLNALTKPDVDYYSALESRKGLLWDGLHPNNAGYYAMLNALRPVLAKSLRP